MTYCTGALLALLLMQFIFCSTVENNNLPYKRAILGCTNTKRTSFFRWNIALLSSLKLLWSTYSVQTAAYFHNTTFLWCSDPNCQSTIQTISPWNLQHEYLSILFRFLLKNRSFLAFQIWAINLQEHIIPIYCKLYPLIDFFLINTASE